MNSEAGKVLKRHFSEYLQMTNHDMKEHLTSLIIKPKSRRDSSSHPLG